MERVVPWEIASNNYEQLGLRACKQTQDEETEHDESTKHNA